VLEVDYARRENVTVSGLTLENGNCAGGAIYNLGTLAVSGCALTDNTAGQGQGGGAILNSGTLTISNSTLSGNTAVTGGNGGAIANYGTTTISNSTLSGNAAEPYYDGTFVTPGMGGAIYDRVGSLSLSNSTLSDNTASPGYGLAIYMTNPLATVTVTGCTLTDNNLSDYDLIVVDSGTLTVTNSYFHSANHLYNYGPYIDGGGNTFN
jgi:hypothetical protein